jgi:peptide chain release factor 2
LRLKDLKNKLSDWEKLKKEVDDLLEIARLDEEDKDVSLREETEKKSRELEEKFVKMEFQVLFSGKYDEHNVIMAIHAGAGGVDAMDFAGMLLRMYLRFAEKKGFKARILDESRGAEAGIKSVTMEIKGPYAYGHLKSEYGVHRLVRISPFDAEKMRHTSFALVEVLPEIEEIDEKEIIIRPEDLRIDTFLSSGHGGQSVQTTYSAVRIVHLPTKIMVSCQNERSQAQNKETALKILKAKLFQLEEEKQQKEKQKLRGEYKSAEWGNQIRSYVLHPYHMVKDLRTDYEVGDPDKVLDGELDGFIEAYLKSTKQKASSEKNK